MTESKSGDLATLTCPSADTWRGYLASASAMDADVARHLEACRRCQEVVDGLQSQERLTLFKNSDGLPNAGIATTLAFLRRIEQQHPLDPVEPTLPKITNIET